jgi:hypothetical protein
MAVKGIGSYSPISWLGKFLYFSVPQFYSSVEGESLLPIGVDVVVYHPDLPSGVNTHPSASRSAGC